MSDNKLPFGLKTVSDTLAEAKEAYAKRRKEIRQRLLKEEREELKAIVKQRYILPQLTLLARESGGEIELDVSTYERVGEATVFLGAQPPASKKRLRREFAERMRAVRQLVGNMKVDSTSVKDETRQLIKIRLRAEEYPHVQVVYYRRLGKGDKCRIVKHRQKAYTYTTLVCER
jgi:hypothetical protein